MINCENTSLELVDFAMVFHINHTTFGGSIIVALLFVKLSLVIFYWHVRSVTMFIISVTLQLKLYKVKLYLKFYTRSLLQ